MRTTSPGGSPEKTPAPQAVAEPAPADVPAAPEPEPVEEPWPTARPEAPNRQGGPPPEDWLDMVGVARHLHLSPWTIRAMRKRGRFPPACKVGRIVRWQREDIDAWLREHREPLMMGARRSPARGKKQ